MGRCRGVYAGMVPTYTDGHLQLFVEVNASGGFRMLGVLRDPYSKARWGRSKTVPIGALNPAR